MPLHVFEAAGNLVNIDWEDKPNNFYESHAWTISDANANDMIGDVLYMHRNKSTVSDNRSGIVQHWYRDENGDVVFIIESNPAECEGVRPPPKNVWTRNDWCKF